MRIEHIGLQVKVPGEMGEWYVQHLGFKIQRQAESPVPVRFIADGGGKMMLEIYNNPKAPSADYSKLDPLLFHIAFVCEDVPGTMKQLLAAGATKLSDPETTPAGDVIVFLRDPWGMPIQLCYRKAPMV